MPKYQLEIEVIGSDRGAGAALLDLRGGLDALNVAAGNLIADGIERLGAALGGLASTGLSAATDYQSSLNMFEAVSGATATQMAQVADEAKALGGDMTLPATSAGEAAAAMTELAKAGLSVNDALAAGKGTLQLAAAGQMDEARAAEVAANALNSFGLAGSKATMVADLFAATANKSSVEVSDVADSFNMAGQVFSAFQGPVVGAEQSMIDLTTAIGLLGNVGLKGSDAGTSLKQMLLQLTGPSQTAKSQMQGLMYAAMGASGSMEQMDIILQGNAGERDKALAAIADANPALEDMGDIAYDASGKMRSMSEIIRLLTAATKDMSDEQRNAAITNIFGADASRAVIALMRAGPQAFNDMERAITQQGAAADLAGAQMKGLGGAWEGFMSTFETTGLTLFEPLLGPLETLVRAAAQALADATPVLLAFVTSAVVPAVTAIAQIVAQFAAAPDKIAFMQAAITGLISNALAQLTQSGPGLVAALATWAAAFVQWASQALPDMLSALLDLRNQAVGFVLANAPALINALRGWSLALLDWIAAAAPGMLARFTSATTDLIGLVAEYAPGVLASLGAWGLALAQWVVDAAPGLLEQLGVAVGQLLDAVGAALPGLVAALATWAAAFVQWAIDAAPGLFAQLLNMSTAILAWIAERVPGIAEQLGQWVIAFVGWVGQMLPPLFAALVDMAGQLGTWIIEHGPQILDQLNSWTDAFVQWAVEQLGPALMSALANVGTNVWGQLGNLWTNAWAPGSQGAALLNGLGAGGGGGGGTVPGFASGVRNFSGGLALVGEQGPELAWLAAGTNIAPAGQTAGLLGGLGSVTASGGGAGDTIINVGAINANGIFDAKEAATQMRDELVKLGRRNKDIFGGLA